MDTTDQLFFNSDLEDFFDRLFESVENGNIDPQTAESFIPDTVKEKCLAEYNEIQQAQVQA